ncbi:hypothetical protein PSP6_560031 [Paraburkholderia tropica]|nr:hypothetical protein PSP6_560031 [Paraburkholderia tropica]
MAENNSATGPTGLPGDYPAAYLFLNAGLRFSTNAAIPSF